MRMTEDRARLGYRGSVGSRASDAIMKTVAVIAGTVMVASAFLVSLVFFAVGLAVVLLVGGYLWWKTRHVRKQMRAHFQELQPRTDRGNVIEGVVISRDEVAREERRPW